MLIGSGFRKPGNPVEWEIYRLAIKDRITPESFNLGWMLCRGGNRKVIVKPEDFKATIRKAVILEFTLPPGSYATVLLQSLL